jgi:hypothetical protein
LNIDDISNVGELSGVFVKAFIGFWTSVILFRLVLDKPFEGGKSLDLESGPEFLLCSAVNTANESFRSYFIIFRCYF